MVRNKMGGNRKYYYNTNSEPYSRGSNRGRSRGRNNYYSRRGYSKNNTRYQNQWRGEFQHSPEHSPIARPTSPVEGSEEFTARKIKETSAIIMRQLLSPNEAVYIPPKLSDIGSIEIGQTVDKHVTPNENSDKQSDKNCKVKKSGSNQISVKEIHEKIMNRITNLNDGRKKNFINAHNSTSLDSAIGHIQKQKRLELSRVLRDMCSSYNPQNLERSGELINSIVPDIGIKIEELPIDVIQELRLTLNLDLEEDILDNHNIAVSCDDVNETVVIKTEPTYEDTCLMPQTTETPIDISSEELNAAIDAIEVKNEALNYMNCDAIEIKSEDIVDMPSESVENIESFQKKGPSFKVAEEEQNEIIGSETTSHSLEEKPREENASVPTNNEHFENASSKTDESLCYIENVISQFVDNDNEFDINDLDKITQRVELVDKCIKYLSDYKQLLVNSVIRQCYKMKALSKTVEKSTESHSEISDNRATFFRDQCIQTSGDSLALEENVSKRRKTKDSFDQNITDISIKTELNSDPMIEKVLSFPPLKDKVVFIGKIDGQLVLATETGNIIYASLKDGSFLHTLDVTNSTITSVAFSRGLNDFIYMYVGTHDKVLRVYDFTNKNIIKATPLDEHIRCMDVMWDYVFVGCKDGALIRYSTKKKKIEFEEKNSCNEILVLKAAQEGPRKVLLVGHRQAPIYVRDAFSGLYLRNFSNEAITPTVYALIVNSNFLYCGTAQNSILVFSFHEGNLLHRLFAGNSAGISCMSIYKNLLFSGCYDGSINVYHLHTKKLIDVLKAPGGVICMEVLHNQIILGTLNGQFTSIGIPEKVCSFYT